jgi:AcrR family transcriptional regulator
VTANKFGRPMSPVATDAILTAAADVLAAEGVDGLTIRKVVARSGASSATVYRRWPTKAALIIATAEQLMSQAIPEPPHASLVGDVSHLVRNLVRVLTQTPVGGSLPYILDAGQRSPDVAEAVSTWLAGRRAVVERVLATAVARGEARADLPLGIGAELLSAPVYYRFLVSRAPLDDAFMDVHVREFLNWATSGLRPPLPAVVPPR